MATKKPYILSRPIRYFSPRYKRWVFVPEGRDSDGATGAKDLTGPIPCTKNGKPFKASLSWWVHDELCLQGEWFDGTPVKNWHASLVLRDILRDEGYTFRARTWTWATYLFGGGKARKN